MEKISENPIFAITFKEMIFVVVLFCFHLFLFKTSPLECLRSILAL